MTDDETVGWHHQFNGHESEPTLGDGEGQESLECCSRKEQDTTKKQQQKYPEKLETCASQRP